MRPVGNGVFSVAIPQLDHLDWLIEAFRNTESSQNRHYEHPEIKSNLYTLVRILLGTRLFLNVCQLSHVSICFKDSRMLR